MRVIRPGEGDAGEAVREAAQALREGAVVAYPTETFYALGVRFDMPHALERLFRLKGRSPGKAVSLIVGGPEALNEVAGPINETARMLMERFWPGPLTLLLPAREGLDGRIAPGGRVAVRTPGESFALLLAREAGFAVTATSANPSGLPPPTEAGQVGRYFTDGLDLLVDGGRTPGGPPSTLLDTTGEGVKLLRRGACLGGLHDLGLV